MIKEKAPTCQPYLNHPYQLDGEENRHDARSHKFNFIDCYQPQSFFKLCALYMALLDHFFPIFLIKRSPSRYHTISIKNYGLLLPIYNFVCAFIMLIAIDLYSLFLYSAKTLCLLLFDSVSKRKTKTRKVPLDMN